MANSDIIYEDFIITNIRWIMKCYPSKVNAIQIKQILGKKQARSTQEKYRL